VAATLLLAVVALLIALAVTPPVGVTVFGRNIGIGAVTPNPGFGLSGPGQADLFGEGPVDTVERFAGPIRPLIVWESFNRDDAASDFIQTSGPSGRRTLQTGQVGEALAKGWLSYFALLVVVSGAVGGALYIVLVGLRGIVSGTRHRPQQRRRHLLVLGACVSSAMLVTIAAATLALASTRNQLTDVATLADLTGTARLAPNPMAVGPVRTDVDVVVLGDSTAAGVGNAGIANPTALDTVCGRSRDAYAAVLGSATGLRVTSLACSSATLANGVLGPQYESGVTIPPQLGVLKSMPSVRAVILSVGANDIGWSDFLEYCYGLSRCDDQAAESLFLNRLDTFRLQYAQLLQQLSVLPSRPMVVVTGYYDPFGDTFTCPALQDPHAPAEASPGYGFAADPGHDNQAQKINQKIDPLRSHLAALNSVLVQGAAAFDFTSAIPQFAGHALCSDQSWVQGLHADYPFHPNAAGELAIASVLLPHLAALLAG
jgi:lysophospholipase L1-like esterase